jgi:histidinol phosphatase-like enzyme (inositol monophosphatase family)
MHNNIDDLIKFAGNLADASGGIIRQFFHQYNDIIIKGDNTPVTDVDKKVEASIRLLIKQNYPDHGIIGEEFGLEHSMAKYRWVIDPIDGTTSFMIGRPIFGTLIGLLCDSEPVLGIIDQPITKERWVGNTKYGALCNDIEIKTRACGSASDAILCTTSPEYFSTEEFTIFQKAVKSTKQRVYGGDCYNYAKLASGKVDIIIEAGLKKHDFLPLIPIVTAAGGLITDWHGNELSINSDGRVLVCGSEIVHKEMLEITKKI